MAIAFDRAIRVNGSHGMCYSAFDITFECACGQALLHDSSTAPPPNAGIKRKFELRIVGPDDPIESKEPGRVSRIKGSIR